MKKLNVFCGLLALIGTAAVFWPREPVTVVANSAVPLNSKLIEKTVPDEKLAALREQTRELPSLRNEVTQLRAARRDAENIRADNASLMRAKERGMPEKHIPPPGYKGREQLVHAGFATPADTLTAFFWAMVQGDVDAALSTLVPEHQMARHFSKMSPEKRAEAAAEFQRAAEKQFTSRFNDFAVQRTERLSPDDVVLHVGSSLSTNTVPITLRRVSNEWRIVKGML